MRENELRMYRPELARALTSFVRARDPHHSGVTTNMIKSWEVGEAHPWGVVLSALCQYTGRTARQLGIPDRPRTNRGTVQPEEDEVNRRQLTAGAVGLAGLPVLGALTRPAPARQPVSVGRREIDKLTADAAAFNVIGNARGGGFARAAIIDELEWAANLLHVPCPTAMRQDLFRAVARLAMTGGFSMFDAYDHTNATRVLKFGVACAEEIGDWSMRAKILGILSRQASMLHDPDQALTFVELAQVRMDRIGAIERAMLNTLRAAALARAGRAQDTLRAVGEADDQFARRDPDATPPWMSFYTEPQHVGDTANALFDLERAGHRTQARQRFAACVAGYPDSYARSRAMAQAKLARLVLATGDPREAAVIGGEALTSIEHIRSRRAADDLRALGAACDRRSDAPEVTQLRDGITALVGG